MMNFPNEAVESVLVSLTIAGTNQAIFTPPAGKCLQIVGAEGSVDAVTRLRVHLGATTAKPLCGGYLAAGGGFIKMFGTAGQVGAVDEGVKADMSAAANADVILHYIVV